MPDHSSLNARAARLAGWKYKDAGVFDTDPHWVHSGRLAMPINPPAYCSSLDLIRHDLLPLVEQQGKRRSLLDALTAKYLAADIRLEWGLWLLTLNPAVLCEAVCDVLEGK